MTDESCTLQVNSLLFVFDSIDGAVRLRYGVQRQIATYDDGASPDRAILFRFGIDIGDAITDRTDFHGDVVNVAARLPSRNVRQATSALRERSATICAGGSTSNSTSLVRSS